LQGSELPAARDHRNPGRYQEQADETATANGQLGDALATLERYETGGQGEQPDPRGQASWDWEMLEEFHLRGELSASSDG
jgi:hypothetical protein